MSTVSHLGKKKNQCKTAATDLSHTSAIQCSAFTGKGKAESQRISLCLCIVSGAVYVHRQLDKCSLSTVFHTLFMSDEDVFEIHFVH